jgi:hypothetical protein
MPYFTFTRSTAAGARGWADKCCSYQEPDQRADRSRATRTTTTLVAGGLAFGLTAALTVAVSESSTTTPTGPRDTVLTSSDSFEPEIEQLLNAAQQITDTNSAYPFITPFDLTLLPQYVQDTAAAGLVFELDGQNAANSYNLNTGVLPYLWDANATDPQGVGNTPNPDNVYELTNTGNQAQLITVDPGPGTQDVTFTPMSGNGLTQDFVSLRGYDLSQFTPNSDGSYTIVASSTPQSGNWIDTAGAGTLITRDTIGNSGLLHDNISIQTENSPAFSVPTLSDNQLSSVLSDLATAVVKENGEPTNFGIQHFQDTLPANELTPISATLGQIANGPILPGQLASFGHFSLEPDQALIIKVPTIDAGYSGIQINDAWAIDYPSVTAAGSLNDTDTFQDPNGYTYYVVSDQNPDVANWINDSGATDGNIILRWQDVTGSVPSMGVQTEVVPVTDVSQYLPADTPTVTPAEYATEAQQRLFDYDYRQDQLLGPGWVTSHLELDQVKEAIGAQQFNAIFGGQTDVPSIADRLTSPALIPDLQTIGHDIATTPVADTLSAVIQNVPLFAKDVEIPAVLADLRLDTVVAQTAQALQSDISSGDLSQAMTALGTGAQGLGTVLRETFTDPSTSVTAGILNARDDLAVSIMNAGNYSALTSTDFTSVVDQMSALDQSVSQMLSAGSALFDPTNVASLSADLAPHAAGLLDLLP